MFFHEIYICKVACVGSEMFQRNYLLSHSSGAQIGAIAKMLTKQGLPHATSISPGARSLRQNEEEALRTE